MRSEEYANRDHESASNMENSSSGNNGSGGNGSNKGRYIGNKQIGYIK